jgi:hypothetical protein
MKQIALQLVAYVRTLDPKVVLISVSFLSVLIYGNYHFGLNEIIRGYSFPLHFLCWYLVFLVCFLLPFLVQGRSDCFSNNTFLALTGIAPAIFAWKMSSGFDFSFSNDVAQNRYWNMVAYYPLKLAVIVLCLLVLWRVFHKEIPFYGTGRKHFRIKPYLVMLLLMVPLVAAASMQEDFLSVYPKYQRLDFLSGANKGWYKLLFELSSGSDFVGIELFFRGFMILAFSRITGRDVILPMALFYCTIHFGKPLGECISSFFGGLILGVITYHSRTIWGGLMVHLGIAWLMELGGYLGGPTLGTRHP